MINVLAFITTKPGQRAAVLDIFKANIPAVLAEEGCIEYVATVDIAGADPAFGPDSFVVIEKWASLPALKAHAASPHMAAYAARVKDLLVKRAIHVLDPA